jgi:hypothetical protein
MKNTNEKKREAESGSIILLIIYDQEKLLLRHFVFH